MMLTMKRLQVFCLFSLGIVSTLSAQRVKEVRGEYVYRAPLSLSVEQAREVAVERARCRRSQRHSEQPFRRAMPLA